MMRNFAFLLCLCLAASFVAAATPGAGKPATPSGPAAKAAYLSPELLASLESHPNLAYAKRGDQELQLDLFRPKDRAGNLPGIVCIHGGGWWKGKREDHADLARALAARGFVTVTITYRLSGEEPFPAQIDDCKAAVRWLRAHAAEYGVDPTAIGAIGHSAGGHLTALLATSGGVKELEGATGTPEDSQSSAIQAAVAMGAQSDFDGEQHIRENDKDPEKLKMWATFLGGSYHAVPERYHAASPLTYLDVSDPPLYFIAGETDTESTRAETTRHRLFALGVPTGLTVIQGTGHNVFANKAMFDQVVRTAGEFFTTHLVDKGRIPVQVSGAGFDSGLKDRAVWRQIRTA
jgi:pectinesterase